MVPPRHPLSRRELYRTAYVCQRRLGRHRHRIHWVTAPFITARTKASTSSNSRASDRGRRGRRHYRRGRGLQSGGSEDQRHYRRYYGRPDVIEGGSIAYLKNEKGVVIKLHSQTGGCDLTWSATGCTSTSNNREKKGRSMDDVVAAAQVPGKWIRATLGPRIIASRQSGWNMRVGAVWLLALPELWSLPGLSR